MLIVVVCWIKNKRKHAEELEKNKHKNGKSLFTIAKFVELN
jgi:hypothetical protein